MVAFMLPADRYNDEENGVMIDNRLYETRQLHVIGEGDIFLLYQNKGVGLVGFGIVIEEAYHHSYDPVWVPTWIYPVKIKMFETPLHLDEIFRKGMLSKTGYKPFGQYGFKVYEQFYSDADAKTFIIQGGRLQ